MHLQYSGTDGEFHMHTRPEVVIPGSGTDPPRHSIPLQGWCLSEIVGTTLETSTVYRKNCALHYYVSTELASTPQEGGGTALEARG
jgi:hypothetical protein